MASHSWSFGVRRSGEQVQSGLLRRLAESGHSLMLFAVEVVTACILLGVKLRWLKTAAASRRRLLMSFCSRCLRQLLWFATLGGG